MILLPDDAFEVRASAIHGRGVFARAPLAAGVPVARWTEGVDHKLAPAAFARLRPGERAFLEPFAWVDGEGWYRWSSGASRFLNHGRPANLVWDPATQTTRTARAIAADEELTEDYGEFDAGFAGYAHTLRGPTPATDQEIVDQIDRVKAAMFALETMVSPNPDHTQRAALFRVRLDFCATAFALVGRREPP